MYNTERRDRFIFIHLCLQELFKQALYRANVKFVTENNDAWDQCLHGILFANRTAQHDGTKLSPFYVMFGHQHIFLVDMNNNSEATNVSVIDTATVDTIIKL